MLQLTFKIYDSPFWATFLQVPSVLQTMTKLWHSSSTELHGPNFCSIYPHPRAAKPVGDVGKVDLHITLTAGFLENMACLLGLL